MPSRTKHQARNHRDRPPYMQEMLADTEQNAMMVAMACLAPLFRRSGRGR